MTTLTRDQLRAVLEGIAELYPRHTVSDAVVDLYADALHGISAEALRAAVRAHLRDPHRGQYFPKPGDICKALGLDPPSPGDVIALAKLATTPFGVLARIHIGSWDLTNADAFYLDQRAREVIALWPAWIRRAWQGHYTRHELSRMQAHGVDACAPFAPHCLPAQPSARAHIQRVAAELPPAAANDVARPASPGRSLIEAVFGEPDIEATPQEPAP